MIFKISHILFYILLISSCHNENEYQQNPREVENHISKKEEAVEVKDEEWENYMVPAGAHDNVIKSFSLSNTDSLNILLKLDSTAFYTSAITENQLDWNKLIGLSDCGTHHLKNSIRIVWRWSEERGLELGKYMYQNEVRSYESLQTIKAGSYVQLTISIKEEEYLIAIDEDIYTHPRKCNSRFLSYILYPYFGGDEPAPQNVNHFIQQIFP